MFALQEDQLAVQEMVNAFASEKIKPYALQWDEAEELPIDAIKSTAELGMGGIYVREDVGGSQLTRLDAAVIFEGLAKGCPSFSAYISIHNMVAWMIDQYGNEQQRKEWLPKLCSMEWLASYCLTEPGSGSDAAALKTKAERKGDCYIVNGTKQFISGAGVNDIYLTMVRTSEDGARGISCLMIPKDLKGVSFGAAERKMGWKNQPTAQVIFDNVEVPLENLVGEEGKGFNIAMAGLDGGRLNISACSLGGAQSAFEIACQYMDERQAFGKKLNQFQALQFRIADMASKLEAARLMLYASAHKYDEAHPKLTLYSAMAKRFVTDAGFEVANDALQMLGGYGYLSDYGIEKLVRDLRVHQILEGTNEIMRLIIARELGNSN